jgi:serine/threonine protein kinase
MESDVLIGDHIGAYRVTGGGGERGYTAAHRHTGQRVSLFIAVPGNAIELFRRAQMFEALVHPGVPRIAQRGVLVDERGLPPRGSTAEGQCGVVNNRAWLAIAAPQGLPLFDLVARRPMPSSEAARLIHDVADVLAFAHERGVFHNNLSLRSIVVTTGTRVFPVAVVDFGFAGTTRDIQALGTIAYRAITQMFPPTVVDAVPNAAPPLADLVAQMLNDQLTAVEARDIAAALLAPANETITPTPRWSKPRWTPAPPITSDLRSAVSGEIRIKDR